MLRKPPRWLSGVAWLVIAVEVTVAGGFLVSGAARDLHQIREPAEPRGGGLAEVLDGTAPSGTAVDRGSRTEAVRDLLAARARAVIRRDRASFLATVDPAAPELRTRQAAFFDHMAAVPIGTWSYRLDPEQETLLPAGVAAAYGDAVWAPEVRLRYGIAGYDPKPTVQQARYRFVRYGTRWYLADDGLAAAGPADETGTGTADGTVRNLWHFGPVSVVRGRGVLVLGHPGSEALMRTVRDIAEQAVPAVSAVWGDWRRRVVILVPNTTDELGRLVEEPGDLSGMAAFTSADVPASGPPVGRRVVINPKAFGDLSPFGKRVVLTHEVVHVATRHATSRGTPHWLAEGFADYVAYRGTGVSPRRAARELAHEVADGTLPDRLPELADFRPGGSRISQAYQEAWLACRMIAQRTDVETLVRLYRRLSTADGDPDAELDAALRDELGLGTEDFVGVWRHYLDEHLGDE